MALVILSELDPSIGVLTLNDPDNLNCMSEEMAVEFSKVCEDLEKRATPYRALILTGAGRAFSAGGDLKMLQRKIALSGEENRLRMLSFYDSFLRIRELGFPLLAAINGHAVGAGLCLASACDVRVCATGSRLGFTFPKLGLHPGMGATYFLPQLLGIAKASELLLTGRIIEAEEAERIGLVSRVVGAAELSGVVETIAKEITSCGREAVRQLLQSLRSPRSSLETALEREALCQSLNYASAEFAEGVAATIEKRKPEFK